MTKPPKFKFPQTVFSDCRRLRYTLSRTWHGEGIHTREGFVQFVGLNPSTADEVKNDPTVAKCMKFARSWGFSGMVMTNIFPLRSTDPRGIYKNGGPETDDNLLWLLAVAEGARLIVAAWGNHGAHLGRGKVIAEHLNRFFPEKLHCLSKFGKPLINLTGHPIHPLYQRDSTGYERWQPGEMTE